MPQNTKVGASVAVVVYDPEFMAVAVGRRKSLLAQGRISVPGGWMEYGESPKQAGLRELLEETGWDGKAGVGDDNPVAIGPVLTSLVTNNEGEAIQCQTHYLYIKAPDDLTRVRMMIQSGGDRDMHLQNMEPDKCEGWWWLRLADLATMDTKEFYPGTYTLLTHFYTLLKLRDMDKLQAIYEKKLSDLRAEVTAEEYISGVLSARLTGIFEL